MLNSKFEFNLDYQLLILLYIQKHGFKKVSIADLLSDLKIDDEPSFIASILMLCKVGIVLKE